MKKEFAISYRKTYDGMGTVYRQNVNISTKVFNNLIDALEAERVRPRYKHNDSAVSLFKPLKRDGNKIFLTIAQTKFFNSFLRLPLHYDRNTTFTVVD